MTKDQFLQNRNRKMYEKFVGGAKYKQLAHEFCLTMSGVKQALAKHRKERAAKINCANGAD